MNRYFISSIMAIARKTSREMSNACASPFSVFSESHVTDKTAGSIAFTTERYFSEGSGLFLSLLKGMAAF